VGHLLERHSTKGSGKVRYTAVYHDLRGKRRSPGTYSNKKAANKAWQKAENDQAAGKIGDQHVGVVAGGRVRR
jgi:hypothetical protein